MGIWNIREAHWNIPGPRWNIQEADWNIRGPPWNIREAYWHARSGLGSSIDTCEEYIGSFTGNLTQTFGASLQHSGTTLKSNHTTRSRSLLRGAWGSETFGKPTETFLDHAETFRKPTETFGVHPETFGKPTDAHVQDLVPLLTHVRNTLEALLGTSRRHSGLHCNIRGPRWKVTTQHSGSLLTRTFRTRFLYWHMWGIHWKLYWEPHGQGVRNERHNRSKTNATHGPPRTSQKRTPRILSLYVNVSFRLRLGGSREQAEVWWGLLQGWGEQGIRNTGRY